MKKYIEPFMSLLFTHHSNGKWQASIGKFGLFLLLLPAMWFWLHGQEIQSLHGQVLMSFVVYSLGKKVVGVVGKKKEDANK